MVLEHGQPNDIEAVSQPTNNTKMLIVVPADIHVAA